MIDGFQVEAYPIVSCGLDWLTCTAKNTDSALAFERVADAELDRQRDTGLALLPTMRLGFNGYKAEHFFFGRREHDLMIQASGPGTNDMAIAAVPFASNVSRLDLQVTIWTEGEALDLARDGWQHLRSLPNGPGRPRSFSLIIGHPSGQTLYVNSRASDNFGRLYDKGVESKLGPAGLVWRYEVELKRDLARHAALEFVRGQQPQAFVSNQVHQWMTLRGVRPRFSPVGSSSYRGAILQDRNRDILFWFKQSVSKSIQKAIKTHGLTNVIESLGLQDQVQPK